MLPARDCSAAIGSACHRQKEAVEAAAFPVRQGAISTEGSIGPCCFTSCEVSILVKDNLYPNRHAMSTVNSGTAAGSEGGQAESE